MYKIKNLKKTPFLFLFASMFIGYARAQINSNVTQFQNDFVTPTKDNTLWCYWYWIADDISKEGITKDLQAMKEAGIGGALIGNINPDEKDGKVPMLSEEWWSHIVFAVEEGKRIGVEIGMFNCPGWSQSGGPWVEPEMAMRYMSYSEITVEGGKNVNVKLVKPDKEFQDVYVLAFPEILAEKHYLSSRNAKILVTPSVINQNNLIDGDTSNTVQFSKEIKKYWVDIFAKNTIKARSIKIIPGKEPIYLDCNVYAKKGKDLILVKSFKIFRSKLDPSVGPDIYAPILIDLPEVNSNNFRLEFIVPEKYYNEFADISHVPTWELSEISISEAEGLAYYAEKNLSKMHPTPFPAWDSYLWEKQPEISDISLKVQLSSVIDISEKMDSDGTLNWNAPIGNWTIQRFGMIPTGTKNSPSAPQGKGYEIDKTNKKLVQYHYSKFIGELVGRLPDETKSAFKYVIADSYEMGSQNWTDGYEKKFESQFGYNPKKYLPVFSGRIVGSVEESERFLWDLRRSVADAVAEEYVGGLKEAGNKDNLKLWLENYGHWGFPSEFLLYGGKSDLVSGEFWNEGTLGNIECKSASSSAHIYGKSRVSAEAFTAGSRTFVRHPAMLKRRGDWAFTEGINHLVLHVYIHQPDDSRVPGVNAWFGTEFNRHNTWFKKSTAYFEYLRRCQYLLQQGNYVADVCYFIGEDAPIMTGVRNPELPYGYSYDYINADVILNRVTVKNGKFVLPDGMSYSLMVLPPFKTMRPELLARIEELVRQGGKVFGSAPVKSPSLQNYPVSDKQVKYLASKMWESSKGKVKKYGDGFIIDGLELRDALSELNIGKDVDLHGEYPVLWTHRKTSDVEIYFLTNQSDQEIELSPSFRVSGLRPQLWDAETGIIRSLAEFTDKEGRITIPLKMQANQSWFLVFSKSLLENAKNDTRNFSDFKIVQKLDKPWVVDFQNKKIGPKDPVLFPVLTDWISNEKEEIKYYSGTAIYTSTFNYVKNDNEADLFIDLGSVGIMASVKINGINIGTKWIAPFKLNLNGSVNEGENTIEIEVVNVWRNRITGDSKLSLDKRTTWLLDDKITSEESLIPSGLIGPVTIQSVFKE